MLKKNKNKKHDYLPLINFHDFSRSRNHLKLDSLTGLGWTCLYVIFIHTLLSVLLWPCAVFLNVCVCRCCRWDGGTGEWHPPQWTANHLVHTQCSPWRWNRRRLGRKWSTSGPLSSTWWISPAQRDRRTRMLRVHGSRCLCWQLPLKILYSSGWQTVQFSNKIRVFGSG